MKKKYLITGGSGFIGSALAIRLLQEGSEVVVFDNNSRGCIENLSEYKSEIQFINGDIRNKEDVLNACIGIDAVCHLAYINGTSTFYAKPHLILEVALKGMMNIIDACIKNNISEFFLASSSEVYQNPIIIPTDESIELKISDIFNPRFSYGGGKIISELIAINFGRKFFEKVIIFRPHNVYGPNMGNQHVIPEFIIRMSELDNNNIFKIQGSGEETRSFIYISDFIEGLSLIMKYGKNLNIYNIGTSQEIKIKDLVKIIAKMFNLDINLELGSLLKGSPKRRCPDIKKITELGFNPKIDINEGIKMTKKWYVKGL
tara:strand:+ start:1841 stop:2788 length:948 start_codon:yes stop_codon:yes gene_type:complete